MSIIITVFSIIVFSFAVFALVRTQAVPRVKHIIRMSSWTESIRLAQRALQYETEELISRFLTQDLNRLMPETFGPDGLMLY